jgi:hypothetical protein
MNTPKGKRMDAMLYILSRRKVSFYRADLTEVYNQLQWSNALPVFQKRGWVKSHQTFSPLFFGGKKLKYKLTLKALIYFVELGNEDAIHLYDTHMRLIARKRPPEKPKCCGEGCTSRAKKKGMCKLHYDREWLIQKRLKECSEDAA